jgi:uncharacterized protein YqhQ
MICSAVGASERPPDSKKKDPQYYGGQAVLEGVMMRGADTWAVAVRRPTKDIYVERRQIQSLGARHPLFRKPFLRGISTLVESLSIGIRALVVSANQSLEEDEKLTPRQMAITMGFAMTAFIGIFVILPTLGLSFVNRHIEHTITYNIIEGLVRIGIFVGYLLLISRMQDIRRVFMYHGAEHKTIAAYEAGEPTLDPPAVDRYSTLHVRCGTNFLIIVMILTIFVFTFFGRPALWLRVVERVLAIPLIAGISYEALRLGARYGRNLIVRALMQPGLWLQKITTKPPTPDQIEVAIRAFEAVLPEPERTKVAGLPSPTVSAAPAEA